METESVQMSCGVREVFELDECPETNLLDIAKDLYEDYSTVAFVMWSDVFKRNSNGNKLYHFIRHNFPKSSVIRTKSSKNPNSGHKICVYVWKIPNNFKKWWKKNKAKPEPKPKAKFNNYIPWTYAGHYGGHYP